MTRYLLPVILLCCCCLACTGDRAPILLDPEAHEWVYDLANTRDTANPILTFSPGDHLSIAGDTITVVNEFSGWPKQLLRVDEGVPRSKKIEMTSYIVTPQPDSSLRVWRYGKDSIVEEYRFHLPDEESIRAIPEGMLTGKTFRCKFPEADSVQVYFGFDEFVSLGRGMNEYYVALPEYTFQPISTYDGGKQRGWSYSHFSPLPLRGKQYFISFNQNNSSFRRYRHRFTLNAEGLPVVRYIEYGGAHPQILNLPLVPTASMVPPEVSIETFCARVNSGRLTIDQSYTSIDTSSASFADAGDAAAQKVLEIADLEVIEVSLNPKGEYFVLAGERLIMNGRWEFSPDRNYLILLGKKGQKQYHLPIVKYTNEELAFRLPLKVKTREPKGVRLISYGLLDAYVQIDKQ
ncbi:MAG: hypothetical protein AAF840_08640 [Bacteroidota bacterium]